MNTTESLTLLSLIVTTLFPVFVPLIDTSIIGITSPVYHDINQSKIRSYSFVIGNYGIGAAEKVKVSISSSPYQLINTSIDLYLSSHWKHVTEYTPVMTKNSLRLTLFRQN